MYFTTLLYQLFRKSICINLLDTSSPSNPENLDQNLSTKDLLTKLREQIANNSIKTNEVKLYLKKRGEDKLRELKKAIQEEKNANPNNAELTDELTKVNTLVEEAEKEDAGNDLELGYFGEEITQMKDGFFDKITKPLGFLAGTGKKILNSIWNKLLSLDLPFGLGKLGVLLGLSKKSSEEVSKNLPEDIKNSLENLRTFPNDKKEKLKFRFDENFINKGETVKDSTEFLENFKKEEDKNGGTKKGDNTRIKESDFWLKVLGSERIEGDEFLEGVRLKVWNINQATTDKMPQDEFFDKLSKLNLDEYEKKTEDKPEGTGKPIGGTGKPIGGTGTPIGGTGTPIGGTGTPIGGTGTPEDKPEGTGQKTNVPGGEVITYNEDRDNLAKLASLKTNEDLINGVILKIDGKEVNVKVEQRGNTFGKPDGIFVVNGVKYEIKNGSTCLAVFTESGKIKMGATVYGEVPLQTILDVSKDLILGPSKKDFKFNFNGTDYDVSFNRIS